MNIIKKLSLIIIATLCLFAALSATVFANSERQRVVDNADLLSESEEETLAQKLDSISQTYKQDVIVVTTKTLEGKSVELYTRDYYVENGYGVGDTYSGIIFLVYIKDIYSEGENEYHMATSGDAIEIFGDGQFDSLESAFYDYLADREFYNAFSAFADECEYIFKYDGKLTPIWILISLIVGAIIAGIVVWRMSVAHKGVKAQPTANNYMLRDTFRLERSRDIYLYSHVTRVARPQNNGSSGGGISSSGRSFGGRSGKF